MNQLLKIYSLKLCFTLAILAGAFNVFGQDPVINFDISAAGVSGKKMSGVKVIILRDGQEVFNETTGGNGRVSAYQGYYEYNYEVKFIKDGYVSKTIAVNTKDNFYEEDVEEELSVPVPISMVQKEPGIDYSPIESKPVGRYKIDKTNGYLDLDNVYNNKRKQEVNDFFKKIADDAKNKDKRFKSLVKAGDKAKKKKDYTNAIKNWKEALKIKDDDDLRVKIVDTEMLLDDAKEEEELNKKFNDLIASGNQLLTQQKFDEAIAKYTEAQKTKPKDKLPKQKIKEVAKARLNAEKNKIQKQFDDLMAKADKEIGTQQYTEALATLEQAKTVKPTDKKAPAKIKEINDLLAKKAKNKAEYDKLIASAEGSFNNKSYKDAKSNYQAALDLIPGEQVPTNRIKEIDKLLAEQAKAEKDAEALKKKYDNFISEGDKALRNKSYTEAKQSFQEAAKLFPNEQLPKDKLQQIQNELKQLNDNYTAKVKEADGLLNNKQFDEAITAYKEALNFKKDPYPTAQILKAQGLQNKALTALKDAKNKKETYDKLIAQGDKLLRDKNYQEAINTYTKASNILPDDPLAKTKISEATAALNIVNQQYQAEILKADGLLESGEFQKAIDSYNTALNIKTDQYPVDQIKKAKELLAQKQKEALNAAELENEFIRLKKEADSELSNQNFNKAKEKYQQALALKKDDAEVTKQITLIDDIIKKRKAKYDDFIAKADNDFKTEEYLKAIANYEEALLILPIEQYPKNQIKLAREKLNQQKNSALQAAEKEAKYKALIEKANLSFNAEKYKQAKQEYTNALNLKPAEEYPKNQLAIIETKLKELADKQAAEKAWADKNVAFKGLVDKADLLFANKKYEQAKQLYKSAYAIKNEAYVQNQIDKVNEKLKEVAQQEDLKKQYDKIIKVADQKFKDKEYDKALGLYKRAMSFNPSDKYPPLKITEIEKIKAELAKQEQLAKEEAARNELKYKKLIEKGDGNMRPGRYELAKSYFNDALAIKANEPYPTQKLKEIEGILNKQKAELEKLQAQGNDYLKFNADLYGDEVEMDEGDVNLIITKTKDDQEYRKYLKLRTYIDSLKITNQADVDQNITRTYFSYEDYGKMKELIAKQQKGLDAGRRGNVDQYRIMKDYFATENGKQSLKAYNHNGEIAEILTDFKQNIEENELKGQKAIEPNAEYYQKLKDDYATEAEIAQKQNINKTGEIADALTQIKESIAVSENDGQEQIEKNNSKYVRLNDKYREQAKDIADKNTDKTSELYKQIKQFEEDIATEENANQLAIEKNATYYKDLKDKYATEAEETRVTMDEMQGEISKEIEDLKQNLEEEAGSNQLAIEKNSELYNTYKDTRNEEAVLIIEKNTNKTSEIAKQTEDIKEKIRKENTANQLAIEKNAKKFQDYNDDLAKQAEFENKKNESKTSEIFNQTTQLKDKLQENQNDGQLAIEKNAKVYQEYKDEYNELNKQQAKTDDRKGQELFNRLEKQKDDIGKAASFANLETEKKAIKYEKQADDLARKAKIEGEDNESNTYNTSQVYTQTKDNLDKKQSDDIASQLALIFPEGVTQKIYQRKNDKGDVIEITVRRIVVNGNRGNEYIKTTSRSGTYYFKNNQPISDSTWDIETSGKIVNE